MRALRFFPFRTQRPSQPATPRPEGEDALVNPFAPAALWQSNPARLIASAGFLLIAAIVAAAWMLLANLRSEQLLETQDELRFAIARDELLLHYQPQKTMAGEIVGFEALARWLSPKRGLVSPAQFIPIAEESGLIIPLGELVLRQACREAARWPAPLTVAVNISPAQFRTGDLSQLVRTVLMQTGLSPARLELEVTESVLIDDFSRAISILGRLKALGVRIALDDFGSGYSSLSYLHSFSFDKIKIDRTFIGDIETNRHSKAIVRAVIDLGHSLNVPILAEGVETPAQLALLERNGCDEVQGYLTGRPRPIAEYEELTGGSRARRRNYATAG